MPKKKSAKAKKASKSSKPEWLTEEVYKLSLNVPALVDNFRGPCDKNQVECTISRDQAGLFLWQLLLASDKKAKARRDEAVKAEAIETAVRNFGTTDDPVAASAAGILAVLCQSDAEREAALACKPSVIGSIQRALAAGSTTIVAEACSLLKVLAAAPDGKLRVLKAWREWDWTPLLASCTALRSMAALGSRRANIDCMQAIDLLTTPPAASAEPAVAAERTLVEAAQRCVHSGGGLETMIAVAGNRGPPVSAGCAAAVLLRLFKVFGAQLRGPFVAHGGVAAMVRVLTNPYVALPQRASAAGCLWSYMVPDKRVIGAPPGAGLAAKEEKGVKDKGKKAGTKGREGLIAAVHDGESEEQRDSLWIEEALLDDSERDRVLACSDLVAQSGAVPLLVQLCAGPSGPLAEVTAAAAEAETGAGKKKKGGKKKGGKKKAGKLEPGMEEAQVFASGCLRLVSLIEERKDELMRCGAPRYLTPLLDTKVHQARWHARQTLLNLSMVPEHAKTMELYKLPNYITGGNIPASHFGRPLSAPVSKGHRAEELNGPADAMLRPPATAPAGATRG